MSIFHRLALFVLAGAALLAGFTATFACWWGESSEGLGPAALARQFVLQAQIHQQLEARDRVVLQCLEGKLRVQAEFLAGRLTLDEVVEQFRRLEDARDEELGVPPKFTGPEREEKLRQTVRLWFETRRGAGQPPSAVGANTDKLRGL